MKTMVKPLAFMLILGLTSACVPTNQNYTTTAQNAALGAVGGAALGNMLGHDSEATVTGAVIGAAIGSQVKTGNWGLGGAQPQYPQQAQYPQYQQPHYQQPYYPQNHYQTAPQQGYYGQPQGNYYGNQPVRPNYR